jgi:hypothetical protein
MNKPIDDVVAESAKRDLYLLDPAQGAQPASVIYIPEGWEHDLSDEDDGPKGSIYGYGLGVYGEGKTEYSTYWYRVSDLEKLNEITEAEARQIDPGLFQYLDKINREEI